MERRVGEKGRTSTLLIVRPVRRRSLTSAKTARTWKTTSFCTPSSSRYSLPRVMPARLRKASSQLVHELRASVRRDSIQRLRIDRTRSETWKYGAERVSIRACAHRQGSASDWGDEIKR